MVGACLGVGVCECVSECVCELVCTQCLCPCATPMLGYAVLSSVWYRVVGPCCGMLRCVVCFGVVLRFDVVRLGVAVCLVLWCGSMCGGCASLWHPS